MPTDHKDYSGTPLPRKLGIRDGSRVYVAGAPDGFASRLAPLPGGVELAPRASRPLDVILLFVTRTAVLEKRFGALARALDPAGRLWIAWPKKAARLDTDLDFTTVQRIGLDAGLVDNKSGSITEAFQGLQFVYRLRDRPAS